jgi:hypothetical protein
LLNGSKWKGSALTLSIAQNPDYKVKWNHEKRQREEGQDQPAQPEKKRYQLGPVVLAYDMTPMTDSKVDDKKVRRLSAS